MNRVTDGILNRRRQHWVDVSLQGYYITGLLLLELILWFGALWMVYQFLLENIDTYLYRFHLNEQFSISRLWPELVRILLGVVITNLIAIALVTLVWHLQVRSIITPLRRLLMAVDHLDFRSQGETRAPHLLLLNANRWQQLERSRCQNLHSLMKEIREEAGAGETQKLTYLLKHLKQQLPG